MTNKGRITLPKAVRERLRLDAGTQIELVEHEFGFLTKLATRDFRALKGVLRKPDSAVAVLPSGIARKSGGG